ncbi:hypothetical protein OK349_15340 [Sphingomonas sp. BT-65]|uniref:hypothetical protein n=1 Tax=Sphingomonas sp. BT-65 TaxID=2989821 RepID=UPI002236AC44|nr:hypothetical protein [Sphingomonas sp. BT-65]MCW4463087.1 hypothetical protein [Sphingomonas sp. BT-65]
MAIKALNGLGWYAAGLIVAPGCYLVSSMVAAERTRVDAVERAIAEAHKDIRGLETEFDTRANLAQLERWNGEVMRYTAPTPQQFLASDTALASMRALETEGVAERYAAMVVPEGVPDVVAGTPRTASDAVAAAPAGAKVKDAAVAAVKPAPKPEKVAAVTPKPVKAPEKTAPKPVNVAEKAAPKPVKLAARTPREAEVAMLDRKLLKDSSFGDLMKGVRAEARRVR